MYRLAKAHLLCDISIFKELSHIWNVIKAIVLVGNVLFYAMLLIHIDIIVCSAIKYYGKKYGYE